MARIPKVSDFLFAYGTMPHFRSYLDPVQGSAFIQSLCRSLNEASEGQDLLQILTSTTNKVVSQGFQQCPYVISMLTKKFRLANCSAPYSPIPSYNFANAKRGLAVILNHYEYHPRLQLEKRNGTFHDENHGPNQD